MSNKITGGHFRFLKLTLLGEAPPVLIPRATPPCSIPRLVVVEVDPIYFNKKLAPIDFNKEHLGMSACGSDRLSSLPGPFYCVFFMMETATQAVDQVCITGAAHYLGLAGLDGQERKTVVLFHQTGPLGPQGPCVLSRTSVCSNRNAYKCSSCPLGLLAP